MARVGRKPKDKNDKVVGVTFYVKRSRILELGNKNINAGAVKARAIAKAAVEGKV